MPKNLNYETDPTLPRYGTDLIQKGILTFGQGYPQISTRRVDFLVFDFRRETFVFAETQD